VDDRPWQGPAPPAVAYVFATGRDTEAIVAQLGDRFAGVLQVDGYAAYKALVKRSRPGRIRLAFCLAHARRKFVAVHKTTQSPAALEVLQQIAAIYAIAERIRGGTAAQRQTVREAESRPLMDALKRRLTGLLEDLSVKSTLAKAIRCTLGHWDGLTLFLADGRVEIDSNTVERTMRPIALGRHSYLRRIGTQRAQLGRPRLVADHGQAEQRRSADLAGRRAGTHRLGPHQEPSAA